MRKTNQVLVISSEELKVYLDYNPDTGVFTWKERPLEMFSHSKSPNQACKAFNTNYAGKIAGTINSAGYRRINIKGREYASSRLAYIYMYDNIPDNMFIDHLNRDRLDDRICNLRVVSSQNNNINTKTPKNSTTGVVGVNKEKNGKYSARIKFNGKQKYFGAFDTIIEAARARYAAEIEYGFNKFNEESSAYIYIKNYEKKNKKNRLVSSVRYRKRFLKEVRLW